MVMPSPLPRGTRSFGGGADIVAWDKRKPVLSGFLIALLIGGFFGFMGDQLAIAIGHPMPLGMLAGTLAVFGSRGLDFLWRALMELMP
jgi:hypothetical protein